METEPGFLPCLQLVSTPQKAFMKIASKGIFPHVGIPQNRSINHLEEQ